MKVEWLPNKSGTSLHAIAGFSPMCYTAVVVNSQTAAFYRKHGAELSKKIPRCKKCVEAYEKRFGKKVDHDA